MLTNHSYEAYLAEVGQQLVAVASYRQGAPASRFLRITLPDWLSGSTNKSAIWPLASKIWLSSGATTALPRMVLS